MSGLNTPISLSYRAGACSVTLTKEPRGVNHDLIKVEPVNITRTYRAAALTMSSRATKTISLILVSSVWIIGYVRVHTTQKAWLTSGNIFYPKFNPLIHTHTHTQLGKRPNCRGVYSSRRPNILPQRTPIFFPTRDPYFSVKKPKTIKKGQYYAYLDLI